MNRDEKAAVIDRIAGEIQGADAVYAVDYRGLSVKQAVELRASLRGADAQFQGTVPQGTFTDFDCDIVYANGAFIAYPEK